MAPLERGSVGSALGWPMTRSLVLSGGQSLSALLGLFFLFPLDWHVDVVRGWFLWGVGVTYWWAALVSCHFPG